VRAGNDICLFKYENGKGRIQLRGTVVIIADVKKAVAK